MPKGQATIYYGSGDPPSSTTDFEIFSDRYFGAGVAVGAVGAAAAHPYYGGPACGYYPYPPCY